MEKNTFKQNVKIQIGNNKNCTICIQKFLLKKRETTKILLVEDGLITNKRTIKGIHN